MKLYLNAIKGGLPYPRKKRTTSKPSTVHGHGINDAGYQVKIKHGGRIVWECPIYYRWTDMLRRAYDPKYHETHPTYKNVEVCDKWLTFSNFSGWYNLQNVKDDYHLDKDIIQPGNKTYCPEYCRFIPSKLNNLLNDNGSMRGDCLIGVSWDKSKRKYRAKVSYNAKRIHIGWFNDGLDAHKAYVEKKLCIINDWVLYYKDIDPLIAKGLFYHSCNLNNYIHRV